MKQSSLSYFRTLASLFLNESGNGDEDLLCDTKHVKYHLSWESKGLV